MNELITFGKADFEIETRGRLCDKADDSSTTPSNRAVLRDRLRWASATCQGIVI
jgi:hypothetical protein